MPRLPKNGEQPTADIIVMNVPLMLRNRFKAWCQLRDLTVAERVAELIREVVKLSPTTTPPPPDYAVPRGQKASSLYVNNLPRDLRQRFRAWCTLNQTTIQKKLVALIEETLKGEP